MEQKYIKHITVGIVGAVLIIAGILFAVFYTVPQNNMQALPFVLGGIGLIYFVGGFCNMITVHSMKKDENLAKQMNDFMDERADLVEYKAKAKTDDFTSWIFTALLIFLAVMQVHLAVLLVFVGVFFIRMFLILYLVRKYDKEI